MHIILTKSTLFFILFSLLFIPCVLEAQAKKKNLQLEKAQELIKVKNYNEAMKILVNELVSDTENSDLILSLMDQIQKEKEKVINMISSVKENIKQGNYQNAEEIINEIQKSGDFDTSLSQVMKSIEKEKETLQKINTFNSLAFDKGEKALLSFDLSGALNYFKSAIDIYRLEKAYNDDLKFNDGINRFNQTEKQLWELKNDFIAVALDKEADYDRLVQEHNIFLSRFNKWKQIEDSLKNVKKTLNTAGEITKKMNVFDAYSTITDKYLSLIRRVIQKNAQTILNGLLNLIEKSIPVLTDTENPDKTIFNQIIDKIDKIEPYAFYNLQINLAYQTEKDSSFYYLMSFLNYNTRKYQLLLQIDDLKMKGNYNAAEKFYNDSLGKISKKELLDAEISLKRTVMFLERYQENRENLNTSLSVYAELNSEFKNFKKDLENYRNKSVTLNDHLLETQENLSSTLTFTKNQMKEADDLYNQSVKLYNSRSYPEAKNRFTQARDKYYEIALQLSSSYLNTRIDKIEEFITEIDQIIYKLDLSNGQKLLENAKTRFYEEKYEEAKKNLDEATAIYKKYNQVDNEMAALRDRINSAMRIQSGSQLSIDDPSYPSITELFKNAMDAFEKKDYLTAKNLINQVLIEKPYYKDARNYEIKILLKIDPSAVEQIFNNYFNSAVKKFNETKYEDALIEFKQLLQYEKDIKTIQKYIYDCMVKLNLTKPAVTDAEKNSAQELVGKAQNSYAEGNYTVALDLVNQALKLWENVPQASGIKLACMQKLKIERPHLSRENEMKYREALKYYSENDFEMAYQITNEILKTQDLEEIRRLNKKSDIKRKNL